MNRRPASSLAKLVCGGRKRKSRLKCAMGLILGTVLFSHCSCIEKSIGFLSIVRNCEHKMGPCGSLIGIPCRPK